MNRMESGVVGDERGATILAETMKALGVTQPALASFSGAAG